MTVKEQVNRMKDALIAKCIKNPTVFWIIFIAECLIGGIFAEIFVAILERFHPVVGVLIVTALVVYGIFGPPLLEQEETSDGTE